MPYKNLEQRQRYHKDYSEKRKNAAGKLAALVSAIENIHEDIMGGAYSGIEAQARIALDLQVAIEKANKAPLCEKPIGDSENEKT